MKPVEEKDTKVYTHLVHKNKIPLFYIKATALEEYILAVRNYFCTNPAGPEEILKFRQCWTVSSAQLSMDSGKLMLV